MSFLDRVLHKHKAKSTAELVSRAVTALDKLEVGDAGGGPSAPGGGSGSSGIEHDRSREEVARALSAMKAALYGDGDSGIPSKEAALALTADACAASLPDKLIAKLPALDFEARKDAASVCGAVFRMQQQAESEGRGGGGGFSVETPGADHLLSRPQLLERLIDGYSDPSIALNCGAILRDAARDERVAELLLASSAERSRSRSRSAGEGGGGGDGEKPPPSSSSSSSLFDRLLSAVDAANFEVASDAFATLRDLLTRHKRVVARRLEASPEAIFGALATLTSPASNYVSRRQGVRLLGEILLERANARAMLRYVSDPDNLKAAMVLLKDQSRSIQFEAFHVFKVFVVNPNKLPAVRAILASNRDKLLSHLADFQVDREDEQFREEKAVVVREISLLGGGESGGGDGGGEGGGAGSGSRQGSMADEVS